MKKKLKNKLNKFIDKYIKYKCSQCGGVCDLYFYDMDIKREVYKCRDCGYEWIIL